MADLFTLDNLFTLGMLILLQAVLGFDNLLYISIESKRVAPERQAHVRKVGIALAIILRVALLVGVLHAIQFLKDPFFSIAAAGVVEGAFNAHSLIVLAGGVFIVYTAFKEIHHMLTVQEIEAGEDGGRRSTGAAIFWIVVMNLVFSFDSILAAVALSDEVWVMAAAIVAGGALMIWLADHVAEFLKKNRMYEVLGLFILLIVGIMLLSEGGHLAHLKLFGFAIEPMAKSTFYFVIFVLVVVDVVQGRFQIKLQKQKQAEMAPAPKA